MAIRAESRRIILNRTVAGESGMDLSGIAFSESVSRPRRLAKLEEEQERLELRRSRQMPLMPGAVPSLVELCLRQAALSVPLMDEGSFEGVPVELAKRLLEVVVDEDQREPLDPQFWFALAAAYGPEVLGPEHASFTVTLDHPYVSFLQDFNHPILTLLDLSNCPDLDDHNVATLNQLPTLSVLLIGGTRVSNTGLQTLAIGIQEREKKGLRMLRVLGLEGCAEVNDKAGPHLSRFPRLMLVDLRRTNATRKARPLLNGELLPGLPMFHSYTSSLPASLFPTCRRQPNTTSALTSLHSALCESFPTLHPTPSLLLTIFEPSKPGDIAPYPAPPSASAMPTYHNQHFGSVYGERISASALREAGWAAVRTREPNPEVIAKREEIEAWKRERGFGSDDADARGGKRRATAAAARRPSTYLEPGLVNLAGYIVPPPDAPPAEADFPLLLVREPPTEEALSVALRQRPVEPADPLPTHKDAPLALRAAAGKGKGKGAGSIADLLGGIGVHAPPPQAQTKQPASGPALVRRTPAAAPTPSPRSSATSLRTAAHSDVALSSSSSPTPPASSPRPYVGSSPRTMVSFSSTSRSSPFPSARSAPPSSSIFGFLSSSSASARPVTSAFPKVPAAATKSVQSKTERFAAVPKKKSLLPSLKKWS